jgi:hypothetical protein
MGTPHKATPEQWEAVENEATDGPSGLIYSCILELRSRIEALEAAASAAPEQSPAAPAPAGGLVAKVTDAVVYGIEISDQRGAIDAILAVAEWLDTRGQHGCSLWLREEVQRHG